MGWEIRAQGDYFDPFMIYEPDSEAFTLRLHHGGRISWGSYVQYERGEADYIDHCNVDLMSLMEVKEMMEQLGHRNVVCIYYGLNPTMDLKDGLAEISTDSDLMKFLGWAFKFKVLEIYCHHLTREEVAALEPTIYVKPDALEKKSGVVIEEIDEEGGVVGDGDSGHKARRRTKPREETVVGGGEVSRKSRQKISNVEETSTTLDYDELGLEVIETLESRNMASKKMGGVPAIELGMEECLEVGGNEGESEAAETEGAEPATEGPETEATRGRWG